jgi:glucose dehydrogenase
VLVDAAHPARRPADDRRDVRWTARPKIILHAAKNRLLFVLDRANGKFISAKNFFDVKWATGYDEGGETFRKTPPGSR